MLDARYEKVRTNGSVVSRAVLGATGVLADGNRSVLGVAVSMSEAEGHWRKFLLNLKKRGMREAAAKEIRSIFNAPDREETDRLLIKPVEKYSKTATRLAGWMEENVPEGLTVFLMPETHRRRLRTTHMVERQNREIKRRTRVSGLFPNEESLLRLVIAILLEVSEDGESADKAYLKMKAD